MVLKTDILQWRLGVIGLLLALIQHTQGQSPSPNTDYFAPLEDLKRPVAHGLANQNFTRCCLRALSDWQQNSSNPDIIVQSSKNPFRVFTNVDDLSKTKTEEQFPCGAGYAGKPEGATRVKISYTWCKSNCGGWQRSRSAVLEQWVQPFVGFILPAAVFCLNVPRKKVLNIPDDLFMNVLQDLMMTWITLTCALRGSSTVAKPTALAVFLGDSMVIVVKFLFGALIAATIGLLNVVVWVLVVFSTAAPMILSGLYEATIDRQVLRAIEKDLGRSKTRQNKTADDSEIKANEARRLKYQIHLLYAVLVGNLKLQKSGTTLFAQDTHETSLKSPETNQASSTTMQEDVDRAWSDVEVLVRGLDPAVGETKYANEKRNTKTRLNTMLECQASFGATIGAPVAFFLGSFLFSVFGNYSKLGDSDVSLSLAFGEWWMTIPHVAIVSGCLLAGNNPNTLEAIVSGIDQGNFPEVDKLKDKMWAPFYKSVYQPVWMWERGRNKHNWFQKVQKQYLKNPSGAEGKTAESNVTESRNSERNHTWWGWLNTLGKHLTTPPLSEIPTVGKLQWIFLLLTASVLIVIPFVLAYVTSFYTPTIGLSCRTFTFVLYFVFQSLLTILWLYDFHKNKDQDAPPSTTVYFFAIFFFIGCSFTAIIGTFMQILGVYRNCLCNLPMGYWGSRDYHFTVSTNSAEGIHYAGLYWLSTGIASICLLVIFCYFGWWYQRHWRMRFHGVVGKILPENSVQAKDEGAGDEQDQPVAKGANNNRGPGQVSPAPNPALSPEILDEKDDLAIKTVP